MGKVVLARTLRVCYSRANRGCVSEKRLDIPLVINNAPDEACETVPGPSLSALSMYSLAALNRSDMEF